MPRYKKTKGRYVNYVEEQVQEYKPKDSYEKSTAGYIDCVMDNHGKAMPTSVIKKRMDNGEPFWGGRFKWDWQEDIRDLIISYINGKYCNGSVGNFLKKEGYNGNNRIFGDFIEGYLKFKYAIDMDKLMDGEYDEYQKKKIFERARAKGYISGDISAEEFFDFLNYT